MSLLLSKSLSQLILPPGGLILLACIGLLFRNRRRGRLLVVCSLLLMWGVSTEPVRDMLLSPLENRYPALQPHTLSMKNDRQRRAIVLLGGGLYEKAPEYGGRDLLSRYSLMRTLYAAELSKQTGLEIYASGGVVLSGGSEPEGLVMQRMLRRFGVDESDIHAETRANNTWENAGNLRSLLKAKGIETIVLVTTAWHMPRSVWVFEAHGFNVIPAPCDYVVEREPYDLRSYLPRWNVLAGSGDALHEYLGIIWYWFRYG